MYDIYMRSETNDITVNQTESSVYVTTSGRGIQGERGLTGEKGEQGDIGTTGLKGDTGDKGDIGEQGVQGLQGIDGPNTITDATNTSITGLIKGNGTIIQQAIADDDYLTPLTASTTYEVKMGSDDNYVTDAEKSNLHAPHSDDQDLSGYETILPVTPTNPSSMYLNGNRQWAEVTLGSSGYAANVYLTNATSTVVGTYKQSSYTNDAAETLVATTANNNEVLAKTYMFELPVNTTSIDAGSWRAYIYSAIDSAAGDTTIKFEMFKRTAGGVEITLFSVYGETIENRIGNEGYKYNVVETQQPSFTVSATDKLGTRIYVKTTAASNRTVTYTVGDGHSSYFITPLAIRHSQLRDKNGEAAYQHLPTVPNDTSKYLRGDDTWASASTINVLPRLWKNGNTNTTSFAVGSPVWEPVSVPDMAVSGITVPTAMTAEILFSICIDRAHGAGDEQDCNLQYRVNGGAWTLAADYVSDLILPTVENFTTIALVNYLDLTVGNTYDFRVIFICGNTGVNATVRARRMTVKTFLAG